MHLPHLNVGGNRYVKMLTLVLLSVLGLKAVLVLLGIVVSRATGTNHGDAFLFFAVGRAMVNGLLPYVDIWENKPPLIFFLSEFSLRLTGGEGPAHVMEALAIAGIPCTLGIAGFLANRESSRVTRTIVAGSAFLFGTLLAVLVHRLAHVFHTEIFGAFFGCVFVAVIFTSRKPLSWTAIVIAGVALLFSASAKEPFALSLFASALLLAHTWKSLHRSFFMPLGVAVVTGVVFVTALRISHGYFFVYLPYLFRDHTELAALMSDVPRVPLWTLGFAPEAAWEYLRTLPLFVPLIGLILLLVVFKPIPELAVKEHHAVRLYASHLVRMGLFAYLTVLAGEMGGQNAHGQLIMIPSFAALFLIGSQAIERTVQTITGGKTILALSAALLVGTIVTMPMESFAIRQQRAEPAALAAEQIDRLLDSCRMRRYLILSALQPEGIYAFTEHSPLPSGPFSVALEQRLRIPLFEEMIFKSLREAKFVLVKKEEYFNDEMATYIQSQFTMAPPSCATTLTLPPDIAVLYRKTPIN